MHCTGMGGSGYEKMDPCRTLAISSCTLKLETELCAAGKFTVEECGAVGKAEVINCIDVFSNNSMSTTE